MARARWARRSAIVWLATALAAQGNEPVFVEVEGLPATMFVQEVRPFVVRVGYDADWLAASAVPLFAARLDVPFHVTLPWLLAAEDRAVALDPPGPGVAAQQVAVGDRVLPMQRAARERAGDRDYVVLELRGRWTALAAGTSRVAPVQVRYAHASRFVEDFLRGRQPVDRQETSVASAPTTIVVREVPTPRPTGYQGAVGEFQIAASLAASAVPLGAPFPVVVVVTGTGDLARLPPLALPKLAGFHVQGIVERARPNAREFVLEVLALRAGDVAVPPIPFVSFVPATAAFVVQHTAPLPLRVTPATSPLPERVQRLVDAEARALAPTAWWPFAAAAGAVLGGVVLRLRRRRAAAAARSQAALARLQRSYGEGPGGVLAAFEDALGLVGTASSGSPFTPEQWDEVARRCGKPAAAKLRELHAAIDRARFGGELPGCEVVAAALRAALPSS